MTCTSSLGFYQWDDQIPISFTHWKTVLSTLSLNEDPKLSSSTDSRRRSKSQIRKSERHLLRRHQLFNDGTVDSFLVSSSISLSRQDVPKILTPSSKPYVSSFKTLVHSTNNKQTQRLNYINDSVMFVKLSKDHGNDSTPIPNSQFSNKHSILSTTSFKQQQQQQPPPPPPSPLRLSPLLKIEGQKHRIVHHDTPIIVPSTVEISLPSNQMATSTSNHPPQTNSSVFTYRSAAAGGNSVRQRTIAETTSNNLLISAERFKPNISTSIRQTRQPLTTTTSTYISSQQTQRSIKSRIQQEKPANSREIYEYPDPFTNCPQEILNRLAQLTKLQLETIDWEKKKRFTKKKPLTNGMIQGKDSP